MIGGNATSSMKMNSHWRMSLGNRGQKMVKKAVLGDIMVIGKEAVKGYQHKCRRSESNRHGPHGPLDFES